MADLATDLTSPEYLDGVEAGFWGAAERDGDVVYVPLHAPDGRIYTAQLDCSNYWDQPIRCLFVDPATKTVDMSFWPRGNQVFEGWVKFNTAPPNKPFICWDQDRGGIDVGNHTPWLAWKKWQSDKNQIVAYLNFLRKLLHVESNGYSRLK